MQMCLVGTFVIKNRDVARSVRGQIPPLFIREYADDISRGLFVGAFT